MMRLRFIQCFCFLLASPMGWTDFIDHLKKDPSEKIEKSPIAGIDFIYMINLDQRPEKWEKSLKELAPYGIKPHRFSAVYGWGLSAQAIQELGVKFSPGMKMEYWVSCFSSEGKPQKTQEFLREDLHGKSVFSRFLSLGAIGCTLSHLSILQDAYEAGYETIWIMEDDIAVKKDPKLLSDVIQELDALVGKEGWDVLYTDMDEDVFVENHIKPYFAEDNDYESELKGDLYFFWRPDLDVSDHARFKKRTVLNKSFLQVGSRSRTHSMIIRRSGMKKILEFVKQHHIFLAYDHELAIVPEIRLINLRNPVVTFIDTASDTNVDFFEGEEIWKKCSQITLSGMSNLLGWYEESQIHKLLHSMRKKKPKVCVEVGAFGGITTFPIANGLQLIEGGTLYAVDAWDQEVALQGMKGAKTIQWWKTLDLNALYEKMKTFFSQEPYRKYVHLIRKTSQEAVTLFADESIDFLVLDGNPSEKQSLEDVLSYFPKVRPGGYIWLQNAQLVSKSKALSFLFQHCHWMEEESSEMQVLFEKKLGL